MDTSKKADKRTVYEIKIAFAIWFVAMLIQHYFTSVWGCLVSAIFLLVDIAWIIGMGRFKRKSYDG